MSKIYLSIIILVLFHVTQVICQIPQKDIKSIEIATKNYNQYVTKFFNYYNSLPLFTHPETEEVSAARSLAYWVNDINTSNGQMFTFTTLYNIMKCHDDRVTVLEFMKHQLETNIWSYGIALNNLQILSNNTNNQNVIYHLNGMRKYLEDYLVTFEKYRKKE